MHVMSSLLLIKWQTIGKCVLWFKCKNLSFFVTNLSDIVRKDHLNLKTIHIKIFYSTIPSTLRVRMGEWNAAGDTEPLPG